MAHAEPFHITSVYTHIHTDTQTHTLPPLVPSPSLRDRGHASDCTRPRLELTNQVDFPPLLHWFHVDKISSAHVYVRLLESITSWKAIPNALFVDCAPLVKANSIEGESRTASPSFHSVQCPNSNVSGNKLNTDDHIYPANNLKVSPPNIDSYVLNFLTHVV